MPNFASILPSYTNQDQEHITNVRRLDRLFVFRFGLSLPSNHKYLTGCGALRPSELETGCPYHAFRRT